MLIARQQCCEGNTWRIEQTGAIASWSGPSWCCPEIETDKVGTVGEGGEGNNLYSIPTPMQYGSVVPVFIFCHM